MLGCIGDDFEHAADVVVRYGGVGEGTHRVDKDCARGSPAPWDVQRVRMQRQPKPWPARPRVTVLLVLRLPHRLQAFRKCEGITVLAPRRRPVTPRRWVPRRFGPFDRAVIS